MKILVCGDRYFQDMKTLHRVLGEYLNHDEVTIVQGDAPGADSLAKEWASMKRMPCHSVPANWKRYGRAAGPIRNMKMLNDHPDLDLVLAFHYDIDKSKGTKHMLMIAEEAGVPTRLVSEPLAML